MTLKTIRCGHCDKEMFVLEQYVRETMFCTLGCMDKSEDEERGNIYFGETLQGL